MHISSISRFFVWFICLGFMACRADEMVINVDDDIMNDDHKAFYTEDFKINSKTILSEYEITNNTGVALVGSYLDEYIGEVFTNTVFKISPNIDFNKVEQLGFTHQATFDSVTVVLRPNGYIYGDSTSNVNISIHKLTSNYELDSIKNITTNGTFYSYNKKNNSTTSYDPTALATFSFCPEDMAGDSIFVRLPDALGLEWFNKIVSKEDNFTIKSSSDDDDKDSDEKFIRNVLNGLTIRNAGTNSAIVGFDMPILSNENNKEYEIKSGITIRLHYHTTGPYLERTYDFEIYTPAYQYNQITADYSKGLLDGIVAGKDGISSKVTDNLSFIHGGLGLMTEIEIPTLFELYLLGMNTTIINADLDFIAKSRSFSQSYPLPKINVNLLKNNGQISKDSINIIFGEKEYTSNITNTVSTSTESEYSLPITYYAIKEQDLLSASSVDHQKILLSAKNNEVGIKHKNVNRVAIGNSNNHSCEMKLKMHYTTFE